MAQATIKGCCGAMLLLLVAQYADRVTAIGQQETDPQKATEDNELQISLTAITEQLTRVMESLSMLQQENAALSQYIARFQADSEARFELLRSGLNELKESCCSRRQPEQCSNQTLPRDCGDILSLGFTSNGTYTVYVGNTSRPLLVYCDMTTDNGGWTVFQRRQDGSENFQRNWVDYATGFGDLYREFWLGNDNIYSFSTHGKRYTLRIDLADFNGNTRYAEYSDFKLGAPWEKYKLISVGTYSGNAGDSLRPQLGFEFSTLDQDNDNYAGSCAVQFKGAWWYSNCHSANLNGYYYGGPHASYADGIEWYTWTGHYYSLKFTEMKIR